LVAFPIIINLVLVIKQLANKMEQIARFTVGVVVVVFLLLGGNSAQVVLNSDGNSNYYSVSTPNSQISFQRFFSHEVSSLVH